MALNKATKRIFALRSWYIPLIVLFLVSLIIRLVWVFYIQKPGDSIKSDMAVYIHHAQELVSGTQVRHWSVAVVPYGIRYFYSLGMLLFGLENYKALAVLNALGGAVCVLCVTIIARYCFSSEVSIWSVGILSCLWYPIITFSSYFLSEIPFSIFMYLSLLFTFLYLNSGKRAFIAGLLYGIAFTIRPQIIMTFGLLVIWILVRKRSLPAVNIRSVILLILPVVLIMGYSMYRYYYFTGEFGLISGHGPINKFWGATDYAQCTGYEHKDGKLVYSLGYSPYFVKYLGYYKQFSFEGRIIDADILNEKIKSFQSKLSFSEKISLKIRNLYLLICKNRLEPESSLSQRILWRRIVCDFWHTLVLFCLFPFSVIGLIVIFMKQSPYLEVIALHILTMLYVAYAYIGEIRYRVPYDFMLIILAILGLYKILDVIRKSETEYQ